MPDMYHPPVGHHEFDIDTTRVISEEACELLDSHCRFQSHYSSENDAMHYTISTDRFDIELQDGRIMTVRLRMLEQVGADIDAIAFGSHAELWSQSHNPAMAMVLEYACFEGDDTAALDTMTDNMVPWVPYIFVGIHDAPHSLVTTVLNAQTGTELSLEDQLSALQVLRALKSKISANALLNIMLEEDEAATYETSVSMGNVSDHRQFYPGQYIDGYECAECDTDYSYCTHQTSWQN